jgi:hypothetical protein
VGCFGFWAALGRAFRPLTGTATDVRGGGAAAGG